MHLRLHATNCPPVHELNLRRHIAYHTAWRQTAYHAHRELAATTEHEWATNNPTTKQRLLHTASTIQPYTDTPLDIDWNHWIGTAPDLTQKQLLRDTYEKLHAQLLTTLTPAQQAITR